MFERKGTGVALEADGTVRVVELTAAVGKRSVSRMEIFPPCGADPFSSWEEGVKKARELGIDVDGSTVGISDSLTYRKTLSFPFRSRSRIMQILVSELEGEIPIPSETVVADFLAGSPLEKGVKGIAFVCSRETVAGILEIFDGGTRLRGIQPLSLGLAGFSRTIGLRDGGAVFCSEGEALLVRMRSSFIESIQRFSSVREGEQDPVFSLAEEAFQTVREGDGFVLACSGSSASVFREHQGSRDIRFLDLGDPEKTAGAVALSPEKAEFAVALGLALRSIGSRYSIAFDLRQGPFSPMTVYSALKKPAIRTAVLGLLVFLFFVGNLMAGSGKAKARFEEYSTRIQSEFLELFPDARPVPGQEVAETRNKLEELKRKVDEMSGFEGKGALAVLARLSAAVPQEISLKIDELSYDSKRLRLEGTVTSFDSVDKVKSALEEEPFFTQVQVQNARVGADMNKISFRLEMEVR